MPFDELETPSTPLADVGSNTFYGGWLGHLVGKKKKTGKLSVYFNNSSL